MGMYTKLKVEIELDHSKKDFHKVVDVLCYMLYNTIKPESVNYFNHPLFETSRWDWMFRSSSFYFDEHEPSYLRNHTLHVDFDINNYDNEIQNFLDWIRPYSSSVGDVGIYQYEEDEQETRVIFTENGKVRFDNPMHKDNEKVTIKFWDKKNQKYWDNETVDITDIVVDRYGNVVYREIHCPDLSKDIDAHFYKDGIRIG